MTKAQVIVAPLARDVEHLQEGHKDLIEQFERHVSWANDYAGRVTRTEALIAALADRFKSLEDGQLETHRRLDAVLDRLSTRKVEGRE